MFRNLISVVILLLWHLGLWAHAFLERADPGSVSTEAPTEIRPPRASATPARRASPPPQGWAAALLLVRNSSVHRPS